MTPPRSSLRTFAKFAARDLAVVLVLAVAWVADARARSEGASTFGGYAVGLLAGLTTTLVAFFAHEWGHLGGAIVAGGTVHAPRTLLSPFLFFFDVAKSSRRAFLAMSAGGYVASAAALIAILLFVPWGALSGRVALLTAAAGVLVTFVLEVPTTVRVARGGELPRGAVFVDETGHPRASSSE